MFQGSAEMEWCFEIRFAMHSAVVEWNRRCIRFELSEDEFSRAGLSVIAHRVFPTDAANCRVARDFLRGKSEQWFAPPDY